jgi:hypothetical protein
VTVAPLRTLVVLLAVVLLASPVDAQRRPRRARAAAAAPAPSFGGHLGYNFDMNDVLLGAHMLWPISPRADLYPSFDYYFVDPGSVWSLNADLRIRPPSRYGVFYLGGGVNYSRFSNGTVSSSETGLNLIGGLEGRRTRTRPYVEARFILGDQSSFQIVGGFSMR